MNTPPDPSDIPPADDVTLDGSEHFGAASVGESSVNISMGESAIMRRPDPEKSDETFTRYEMGPQVAKGGMGAILAVRDPSLRRRVAMKILLNRKRPTREQISRLVHEAQVTGQLEHPNIVPVHELGRDHDGNPFYTMKLISGTTLKTVLEKLRDGDETYLKEYPLSRLLNIFMRAADAIAFAHSRHVIHRDLKPENIMVGDYGVVLVLDWGLAKILKDSDLSDEERRRRFAELVGDEGTDSAPSWSTESVNSVRQDDPGIMPTMQGQTMGTPAYMAPEQAVGDIDLLSERTDIYSLGAILYHILALRPPVDGKNVVEVLSKVSDGAIPNLAQLTTTRRVSKSDVQENFPTLHHIPNRRIPSSLAAVAMKALARTPDDRYGSVQDLQKDMDAYLSGYATAAEDANIVRQAILLARRHKASVGVGVVAAILLVGIVFWSFFHVAQERNVAMAEAERAQDAYDKQLEEAQKRWTISRKAAPEFLERARRQVQSADYDAARESVDVSISMDPTLSDAHFLKGMLLVQLSEYAAAVPAFRGVSDNSEAGTAMALQAEALERAASAAAETGGGQESFLALYRAVEATGDPAWLALALDSPAGLSDAAVVALNLKRQATRIEADLRAANPDNDSLDIEFAVLNRSLEATIESPLAVDLDQLASAPISRLTVHAPVIDFTFVSGMNLAALDVAGSGISDLTPITEITGLLHLRLHDCAQIRDLSPLSELPLLETVSIPSQFQDPAVLRDIATLKQAGYSDTVMPLAEFWAATKAP